MKSFAFVGRWYPWSPREWLLLSLLSLTVWGALLGPVSALSATTGGFSGKLTWQDGQLTAQLGATPLEQVMQEVSRLSGAQVVWLPGVERELPVAVEFTALPLAEALRRILNGKNFMLFYATTTEGMRLRRIWISSPGKGQPVRTSPLVAAAMTPPENEDANADEQDPEEHQRFASIPITTLMETAVHDQDPAERLAAITYLEGRAQEDQRVLGVLAHIAQNDTHPQVQDAAAEVLQRME
jgi:hypothetical protein